MKTSEKIISYIKSKDRTTAKELSDFFLISPRAVFRQVKNLIEQGKLTKIGQPPKVFYMLSKKLPTENRAYDIDPGIRKLIEENFLVITSAGERKEGWEGFVFWCQGRKQDVGKMAVLYSRVFNKYNTFKRNGLISGMGKMTSTFKKVYLDQLFYLDFYSLEIFGKTKLGQILLYAKQSQNRKLIKELINNIKFKIDYVLREYDIDGIGFIPPTVKREVQFMKELERNLRLPLRKVSITKVKTEIVVPQKTLNKLEERVENAKSTFVVSENKPFENILLIDDAVGSGATLNETAAQIRFKKLCRGKIVGLAITGSFKGFDVISEV